MKTCTEKQMGLTVKLYGSLAQYLPDKKTHGEIKQSFSEGLTLRELLKSIALPADRKIMVILVNSEEIWDFNIGSGDELHDGDIVELFPPIIGG